MRGVYSNYEVRILLQFLKDIVLKPVRSNDPAKWCVGLSNSFLYTKLGVMLSSTSIRSSHAMNFREFPNVPHARIVSPGLYYEMNHSEIRNRVSYLEH